jgi:hypothetical protein
MNKDQQKDLTEAFAKVKAAADLLDAAVKILAKFGDKVPDINPQAIEMFAESIKTIDFSVQGIKGFLRVSFLQQIVEPKETTEQ